MADTQVNRYEKGMVDPSATYLKLMAETLGVSTDYLLGLTDSPVGKVIVDLDVLQQRMVEAMAAHDMIAIMDTLTQYVRREHGDAAPE